MLAYLWKKIKFKIFLSILEEYSLDNFDELGKSETYPETKDLEFHIFKILLIRYCSHELDQWNRWVVDTKYGEVYINISRQSDGYSYEDKLN